MAGTIGSVSIAGTDQELLPLCDIATDGTTTPFLRRFATSPAGTVTATDTTLDGVTAYVPSGTVAMCNAPTEPVGVETHGIQDTNWDLAANPGTQSVTLLVYTGSVTVTTGEGVLTVPAGASLTWGVDGDETDNQLTGTLTVEGTVPGATWQVVWTTQ
ncbi:hypothetical protein M2168_002158 [Streptomyces sp. CZ24]|nr:hypothetical protein [Streptomyces sp. CZ24]MDH6189126.1 hypothetical protein [Streptomyces sp. CZ24]